jgi:hypothetical protein
MYHILQVVQTTPTGGSATAAATLSGTLMTTASSVRLHFTSPAFSIGTVAYAIDQPVIGFAIVSPASNGGLTTIQGSVTDIPIPEPSLVACFAVGLMTLGMASRRRKCAIIARQSIQLSTFPTYATVT